MTGTGWHVVDVAGLGLTSLLSASLDCDQGCFLILLQYMIDSI